MMKNEERAESRIEAHTRLGEGEGAGVESRQERRQTFQLKLRVAELL